MLPDTHMKNEIHILSYFIAHAGSVVLNSEDETIVRDYDVESYMKRGLTKTEAINYIKNKLSVKNLWSKMSKTN